MFTGIGGAERCTSHQSDPTEELGRHHHTQKGPLSHIPALNS